MRARFTISQMTPFQRSKDRKVRQEAGKKVDAFYASKGKELDEIYDALVKNRTAQAKALGYENFTELGYNRMIRNSYRRPEVEKFRSQIKKSTGFRWLRSSGEPPEASGP